MVILILKFFGCCVNFLESFYFKGFVIFNSVGTQPILSSDVFASSSSGTLSVKNCGENVPHAKYTTQS